MHKELKEIFKSSDFKLYNLFSLYFVYKNIFIVLFILSTTFSLYEYINLPIEYESVGIKLLESGSSGNSKLNSNTIPGFNLDGINSSNDLYTADLYPDLLENKTFLLNLANQNIFINKDSSITLRHFFFNYKIPRLYNKIFNYESLNKSKHILSKIEKNIFIDSSSYSKNLLHLNSEDEAIISILKSRIKIELDGKKIILTCKMPDPVMSAALNNLVFESLVQFMYNYKQEKQNKSVDYITSRLKIAENNFKEIQLKLAKYRDSNIEVTSELVKIEEQRLLSDFNLSFQIYSNLKQELENANIQLNKDAPIFRTFEYPYVPNSPISYSILKYLLIGFFISLITSFTLISLILFFKYYTNKNERN
jgi:hypothetical protein